LILKDSILQNSCAFDTGDERSLTLVRIFDFSVLTRVFTFVAPYRKRFYLSILLAVVLAVIAPLRPYLIEITVNDYIQHDKIKLLILITEWQVGLIILETILRFYFTFLTSWLGQSVVKDLRVAVFEKVLRLNLSQFDTTPIGTLTTRTINDIETINDIFAEGLIPIVADMLSIIAVLVSMFWMNWRLTFVCLIPFPILLVATYYFKETVNKSFIRVRNAVAALNAFVQEHITGMQVVQAFAAEEREFGRFKRINKEHRNANIKSIFAFSSLWWKLSWPCHWDCWYGMGPIRPWTPCFRISKGWPARLWPLS
jgi:ATP-binding cassette subfamily B multidrug efflux pump